MRDLSNALRGPVKPKHLLLLSSLILLSGCHKLENKTKDVIGATVKDPLALELRNVRASDSVSTTICGEFNAKNLFGGYVGFKPFAIDTRDHDKLTELDDDAGVSDHDQYYLICGDEMQRFEAEANTRAREKAEKQTERDALAAAKRSLQAEIQAQKKAEEQAKRNDIAAAKWVSSTFGLPKLPTPIEQMYCHMGECPWEQIISINDVERQGREVLRAVHSRGAVTETPEGQDYPAALDPHAKVTWKKSTSYVLCSLTRPTSFWWDQDTRSYVETPLHVVSPFGFEYSAVVEYLIACHGTNPGSVAAQHPAELGYVDRTNEVTQTRTTDPKQILNRPD